MKKLPDYFYPIASHAKEIEIAVKAGVRFIQLRLKTQDKNYLIEQIRWAINFCKLCDVVLVINDHWQIALEEGAHYIHLGQDDLKNADFAMIKKKDIKFGLSTHDYYELEIARALEPDYIALGPIWQTSLKQMPWIPQGLERLHKWMEIIAPIPLVAIGGITAQHAVSCIEAGAQAVAVVSDIFRHGDPARNIYFWQDRLRSIKI